MGTIHDSNVDRALIPAAEAAGILGVSRATVRNWRRVGYLTAKEQRPTAFNLSEVLALKERIVSNRVSRLRTRANKSASEKTDGNPVLQSSPDSLLFRCALRLLREAGEITSRKRDAVEPAAMTWRRKALRDIMLGWRRRLGDGAGDVPQPDLPFLRDNPGGALADPLGRLYQSVSPVGAKARAGAYFTPEAAIDAALAAFECVPRSFLDPCCGTGRYLLRAAARFDIAPERLYGFDSDPVAVDIARINCLLLRRDSTSMPNIHCLDALNDPAVQPGLSGTIDAIATNPPWGGRKNRRRPGEPEGAITSGESFSLFLAKALDLLRPGGRLSFLLPEAILEIKAHDDVRRLLLTRTRIRKITLLGRIFPGVFTPVVRLDAEKKPAPAGWRVEVTGKSGTHHAPQSRFAANAGHAFDVTVTEEDAGLLERIYAVPHATLRDNAEWALGIVTGDNRRHVLESPAPGTEPVLRGMDVFRFTPPRPRRHIRFQPEAFQQVAPEQYFRAPEKLVYRFVSDRLVFAYDDRRTLTLNSANILIPRLPGLPVKAVLAFLNSRVFQYVFSKRFRTRKVLRSDLETLPFPLLSAAEARKLEKEADRSVRGESGAADRLDGMVFSLFRLREDDKAAMNSC